MKSKFLQVRKMLLVAAGLLVGGVSSALAGEVQLLKWDFNNWTEVSSDWTQASGTLVLAVDGDNKYLREETAGSGSRGAWYVGTEIASAIAPYNNWTIEFDAKICEGTNTSNYSQGVWIIGKDKTQSWGAPASPLAGVVKGSNASVYTVYVNAVATETTVDLTSKTWYHYIYTYDLESKKLTMTIKSQDLSSTILTATEFDYDYETATTIGNLEGIAFQAGRTNSNGNETAGATCIDNIVVSTISDEDISVNPSIDLKAVNGTSRTITITNNNTAGTLYYTAELQSEAPEAGNSAYTSVEFAQGTSVDIVFSTGSGNLYAYAVNGSATSDVVSKEVNCIALTLNAPTFSVSSYANNKYTVAISSDQTGVELTPAATISYRIGEDGEFSTYSAPVSVDEGKTLYAYTNSEGYTNSATVSVETAVRPTHYATVWTQDYTQITKDDGTGTLQVVLNTNPDFTVGSTPFYNIIGYGEKTCSLNANVGLSTSSNFWLRCNGNNSGILKNGGSGYLGIQNLKVGDVIAIVTSGKFLTAASGLELNEGMSTDTEYYFTATATEASISVTQGTYNYIKTITVLSSSVSATIGATGYTTFASDYALDLNELSGVTAYYASSVEDGYVVLKEATGTVAAGEGLILAGEGTVTIPVAASGTALDGNLLVGCTKATTLDKNASQYVLVANDDNKAEFQSLAENGATIPAGKAYLEVSAAAARTLSIVFGGETTGIAEVATAGVENGAVYNLSGQRVSKPANGLYIVNGKKVVIK